MTTIATRKEWIQKNFKIEDGYKNLGRLKSELGDNLNVNHISVAVSAIYKLTVNYVS